jgi:hypothetical protein
MREIQAMVKNRTVDEIIMSYEYSDDKMQMNCQFHEIPSRTAGRAFIYIKQ